MVRSDLTLFEIPARYNLYSIIKISTRFKLRLFTKMLVLVVHIIME